ncbi:AMP-binding protein [Nocardia macrotermitis]|nr:AMP-binding protein [Nocardia macrotermitis]
MVGDWATFESMSELVDSFHSHPGRIVFPAEGTAVPYRDIPASAYGVAHRLIAAGVRPGETVGVLAPNSSGFVAGFFGAVVAGAAACVLPVRLTGNDPMAQFGPMIAAARMRHVLVAGAFGQFGAELASRCDVTVIRVEECALSADPPAVAPARPSDTAVLQFSSGSTAAPKGVLISHRAALSATAGSAVRAGVTAEDRILLWAPLFHDLGLFGLLTAMAAGAEAHLMPTVQFIRDTAGALRYLADIRGTGLTGSNFAFDRMITAAGGDALGGSDLSRWRFAVNGGERVTATTLHRFPKALAPWGVRPGVMIPGYALAEATFSVTGNIPGNVTRTVAAQLDSLTSGERAEIRAEAEPRSGATTLVSLGAATDRMEIRLTGPSGAAVADGYCGEVEIRGPALMTGYLDDPAATAAAFHDGWLRTGDIGFLSERELFVCGRIKDMIILSGRNLYAEDLEAVAGQVPGVYRRHCVALVDPAAEQAVLVVESDEPDGPAVAQLVRTAVAQACGLPDVAVHVVGKGQLPRTTSGKWRRSATRELLGRISTPDHRG